MLRAAGQEANDEAAEPVEKYMRTFTWNKVRYRADKSIGELVASLQSVSRSYRATGSGPAHADDALPYDRISRP